MHAAVRFTVPCDMRAAVSGGDTLIAAVCLLVCCCASAPQLFAPGGYHGALATRDGRSIAGARPSQTEIVERSLILSHFSAIMIELEVRGAGPPAGTVTA